MKYLVTQWIAGFSLPFGPRVQFWLELSAYLFCTLAVVLLVVEERREHIARRERRLSMASPRGSIWIPPEVRSSVARATKLLGLVLLGVIIGGIGRDHAYSSNQHPYHEVLVLERYDAWRFLLRPVGMKVYSFDFDTPQDFLPGQKLDLNYEQRLGVKHLISADFCPQYCDSNGRRLIYREERADAGY